MAKTPTDTHSNPHRLALLSEEGRMLVDDSTDTDSIAQSWVRLCRRVKADEANKDVRVLPFKALRKTGHYPLSEVARGVEGGGRVGVF